MSTPLPLSSLAAIHAADNTLLPTPLTLPQLQSWHQAAPQFFRHLDTPNGGVVGALPLRLQVWCDLIAGRTKEHQITADMITTDPREQIGVHIWHIEKHQLPPPRRGSGASDGSWVEVPHPRGVAEGQARVGGCGDAAVWADVTRPAGGFGKWIMGEIYGVVKAMKLLVVGWSGRCFGHNEVGPEKLELTVVALVVTGDGQRCFRETLGWAEGPYRGHVVIADRGIVETVDWDMTGMLTGFGRMYVKHGYDLLEHGRRQRQNLIMRAVG